MDRPLAAVSGIALWAVALVVPVTYLGLWRALGGSQLALLLLPLLVLAVSVRLSHRPALILGFPLALLPLLLSRPELTGPRIYGAGAFAALLVATIALVVSSGPWVYRRRRPPPRPLILGLVLGLGFAIPAAALCFDVRLRMRFAAALGPHDGRAVAILGLILFVLWAFGVWRYAIRGLGNAWLRPADERAELERFGVLATQPARAWVALASALLTGTSAALALWAYLRHTP